MRILTTSLATSILLIFALVVAGCQRAPEISTTTTTGARVQAVGWKGESYETRNGRAAITLISADELEYRVDNQTTLLCKYTDQEKAIRVIITALGTQQVEYFRRVPNGLISNDGDLYLSERGWADKTRSDMCLFGRALSVMHEDLNTYYLVQHQPPPASPTALDDGTDGPRTLALVARALAPTYILAKSIPDLDSNGNEYRFSIGHGGQSITITSFGKDHVAGGGDDVVFEQPGSGKGKFVSTPRGANLTCTERSDDTPAL